MVFFFFIFIIVIIIIMLTIASLSISNQQIWKGYTEENHVSSVKNPGWFFVHRGWTTTQFCRDYSFRLCKDP